VLYTDTGTDCEGESATTPTREHALVIERYQ